MARIPTKRYYRLAAPDRLEDRRLLTTVYLDFANALTRLNEAVLKANGDPTPDPATECASASPIACFTQLELDGGPGLDYTGDGQQDPGIRELVKTRLEIIYGSLPFANAVSFVFGQRQQGSQDEEIDFNGTHSSLLGSDPVQDNLNRNFGETQVFPANFEDYINNLCCSWDTRYANDRTANIIELSNALAAVGGHELGHAFGLTHAFAYADSAANLAEPSGSPNAGTILNTYGGQNNFAMASGDTAQFLDVIAHNLTLFGEFSEAVLRFTPGVASSPEGTQNETQGKSGLTFHSVKPGIKAAYVEAATLSGSNDADLYPFSADQGDVLSVTTQGATSNYSDKVFTAIDVLQQRPNQPDQILFSTPNDGDIVVRATQTTFNDTQTAESLDQPDPIFANLPITQNGNYAVKIKPGRWSLVQTQDHVGTYDVIVVLRKLVDNGTMFLYGSDGPDVINISISGPNIVANVNGTVYTKLASDINDIVVELNGGNDQLTVGAGVNKPIRAFGGNGNDTLNGGDGNDMLDGGFGDDTLSGGAGDDYYVYDSRQDVNVDFGTDTILESSGNGSGDTIDLSKAAIWGMGAFIDLKAAATTIVIGSTSKPYLKLTALNAQEVENIIGTEEDDSLSGNDLSNSIDGRGGNDTIYGHGGADALAGGAGNDVLVGHGDVDFYLAQDGEVDALDVDPEDVIVNSDPQDIIF